MTPRERFIEMILYVLRNLEMPYCYGVDVLRQILFEADYVSYIAQGEAVTGRLSVVNGGLPTPRQYVPILNELEDQGDVIHYLLNRGKSLLTPQRRVKRGTFNDKNIRVIERAINNNCGDPAYTLTGWESIPEGDVIPYDSVTLVPI